MTVNGLRIDEDRRSDVAVNARTELSDIGIRLLNEVHMAWSSAAFECEQALHAWFDAAPRHRASSYVAYRAALDREAAAAHALGRLWLLAEQ
ncbi:MAG: hypothetical protein JWO02_27 [Solirubrobacterales bacterium]|nr:hypothetical protein [Solirubrobacterales bacterium]